MQVSSGNQGFYAIESYELLIFFFSAFFVATCTNEEVALPNDRF